MSNTKRARISKDDPAAKLYNLVTRYVINMRDDDFDQWLLAVVNRRAQKGSARAQEMLDLEAKLNAAS